MLTIIIRTKHIVFYSKDHFLIENFIFYKIFSHPCAMFSFKPISEYIDINRSSNPNTKHVYSHMFSFEYSFESKVYVESWAHWLQTHWISSIVISVLYILLVFGGKAYMQSRPKYDLRLPLIMWNLCLAVFSIAGTIRMWPDFIYSLKSHGFVYTVCNKECAYGK